MRHGRVNPPREGGKQPLTHPVGACRRHHSHHSLCFSDRSLAHGRHSDCAQQRHPSHAPPLPLPLAPWKPLPPLAPKKLRILPRACAASSAAVLLPAPPSSLLRLRRPKPLVYVHSSCCLTADAVASDTHVTCSRSSAYCPFPFFLKFLWKINILHCLDIDFRRHRRPRGRRSMP